MDELWQAYIELERIEPDMEKTWENPGDLGTGHGQTAVLSSPPKIDLGWCAAEMGENVLEAANYKLVTRVTRHPGIWLSTQLVQDSSSLEPLFHPTTAYKWRR